LVSATGAFYFVARFPPRVFARRRDALANFFVGLLDMARFLGCKRLSDLIGLVRDLSLPV
jgi:hypothetical protein